MPSFACDHDRLLAVLVQALQDHSAPSDSKSMWQWLEEFTPELVAQISSRNVLAADDPLAQINRMNAAYGEAFETGNPPKRDW